MKKEQLENNEIADAIYDLSKSIRLLGNGNIERGDNSPGAIEGLSMLIRDSNTRIAEGMMDIAGSIRELAQAIEDSEK